MDDTAVAVIEDDSLAKPRVPPPEVMEKVLIKGDLSDLDAAQRAEYYAAVCRSLGLNPLTKPFEYLELNGKLRLYALRDCTDQLRRLHGISIYIVNRERVSDIYIVTARAKDRTGREDESTGAVMVGNLKGDALANAYMKCETKAKRRVTLSIAGLGWADEMEVDTFPEGQVILHDPSTQAVSHTPLNSDTEESGPKLTAQELEALFRVLGEAYQSDERVWAQVREVMHIPAGQVLTRGEARRQLTRPQHDQLKAEAEQWLKDARNGGETDADVPDFSGSEAPQMPVDDTHASAEGPHGAEPSASNREDSGASDGHAGTEASDARTDAVTYATPSQRAALKRLAQQVGEDALADVQDILDHHPEGVAVGVYEVVKQRLRARQAAKASPQATQAERQRVSDEAERRGLGATFVELLRPYGRHVTQAQLEAIAAELMGETNAPATV